MERIICAAIWYDDGIERPHSPRNITTGIVVAGWRHHNCYTILDSIFPNRDYLHLSNKRKHIQGFLTSKGNFVDREVAWDIAFHAGQIMDEENKTLFSEDLY
ncbi:hypothetical protein M0P65_07865 [Candidatus Gracilibacteria bacterium]|jgi:hypothetical protein|nr:hypothetical protein [Candidatus Gracilibacteria bacterium]